MLTSLTRVLTATPVVHFVDDYGIQPTTHTQSGFDSFGRLNSALGLRVKHSKEQPPKQEHKDSGCIHTPYKFTSNYHKPCPQRIQQIIYTIHTALEHNRLEPSLAQKLAGKCSFTATQLFRKVGRAANRALYDHAFSNQQTISRTRTHSDA